MFDRDSRLYKRALVGKWDFGRVKTKQINIWVAQQWKPIPKYCPKVSILMNNWYVIYFFKYTDVEKIL